VVVATSIDGRLRDGWHQALILDHRGGCGGDRRMPEEINCLVTDAICDVPTSPDADEHLAHEGVSASKIDRVGNIMIDSFEMMRSAIEADGTRDAMGLPANGYAVVTLHRPSNVDFREALEPLVGSWWLSRDLPLVFAVHPRTRKKLESLVAGAAVRAADSSHGAAGLIQS
jgi:UDP-N-acetylglucosamine 2-epimerase (non-hydrolysing)